MYRTSPRTTLSRRSFITGSAALLAGMGISPALARTPDEFVASLWPEAKARGVSRRAFDAALGNFRPLAKVMELTRKQPEFTSTVADYIGKRVTDGQAAKGQRERAEWAQTLAAVSGHYGVQPEILLAIWGIETNFGGFMGGGARAASGGVPADPFSFGTVRTRPRPADAEARLDLGLLDAYRGGPTTIRVGDKQLEVNVPAGVRDGVKLRLRGQAPSGGDLLLQVRHLPHPVWRLDGDHLRVAVRVPDDVAALGGAVKVPTLDGEVDLNVPAGSSTGRVLRLRGQGWPKRGGGRGDLLAEVRVTVPESLTPEERELYQRLAAARRRAAATTG